MNTTAVVFNAPKNQVPKPKYRAWSKRSARRVLLWATLVGVAVQQSLRTNVVGLAGMVVVFVAAIGIGQVHRASWGQRYWIALSLLLAPSLAFRTSWWLTIPTLLVQVCLLTLAATAKDSALTTFGVLGRCGAKVARATWDTPLELTRSVETIVPRQAVRDLGNSWPTLLAAAALGGFMLMLLASGDAFFAELLGASRLGGRIVDVAIVALAGLWWMSLAITERRLTTAATTDLPAADRRHLIGPRDAAILLGAIALVLAGYVSSLIVAAFRGARYVQERTNLTYADYARSGFFQMIAVVIIACVVVLACRSAIDRSARRGELVALALAVLAFTFAMVGVSIARLETYRSVFGLTMLRLSTTTLAMWLGCVLVLIALALAFTRWQAWLVHAVILSAVSTLFALQILNPEAVVARENLNRIDWSAGSSQTTTAMFDGWYLAKFLSNDAVPTIVQHLGVIPAKERATVVRQLCESRTPDDNGWSWNASRSAASSALETVC